MLAAAVADVSIKVLQLLMKELKESLSGNPSVQEALPELLPELGKICEDDLKKTEAAIVKSLEEKKAEYMANQEERNAKALQLVDKDGSGCLSLDEFLDMMDIGSEIHDSLMEVLGFKLTPEEHVEKVANTDALVEKVEAYMASKVPPEE